jgi:hypothetical protein
VEQRLSRLGPFFGGGCRATSHSLCRVCVKKTSSRLVLIGTPPPRLKTAHMKESAEPSWGRFFGGCLVLLVLLGGGVATFRYFANKDMAKKQVLQDEVFGPYWAAVRQSDFDQALPFHSEAWLSKHDKDALAAAYQTAIKEHGSFDESYIKTANRFYEPGMEGQAMRVETIFKFADGWVGSVNYNITRATDNDAWKLDQSFTPSSSSLGDGPY